MSPPAHAQRATDSNQRVETAANFTRLTRAFFARAKRGRLAVRRLTAAIHMKKPDLKSQAVMNVEQGDSIEGMWATPEIPQIGVYKLATKKRADGVYEWAHFLHRTDGTRKVLFRGEVASKERLAVVLDAANKQLSNLFGVTMSSADIRMKTLDGGNTSDKVH